MKLMVMLIALTLGVVVNANGTEIYTTIDEVDGKTIVTCKPDGKKGDIIKARIFLYVSKGTTYETGIQAMEVSYENIASYELPGTYELIEGKCKLIMLEEDKKVIRKEFMASL